MAVIVYAIVVRPLLYMSPIDVPPFPAGSVGSGVAVAICFGHAIYMFGPRHALAYLGLAAGLSWSMEQLGVTGSVFGAYHYTGVLGLRLGDVPVAVILVWFEYVYCSHLLGRRLAGHGPLGERGPILGGALLTAALTTAQDLVIDPIMSGPQLQAWIWDQPGPYFGVPVQNYAGWFVTAFLIALSYGLFERRHVPRPIGPPSRLAASIPVLTYGLNILVGISPLAPAALRAITLVVLGPPVLIGLFGIWMRQSADPITSAV